MPESSSLAAEGRQMPHLYLHIGQPKTATTTIQNFLAMNRKVMLADGWLYPNAVRQSIAHHPLQPFFSKMPLFWISRLDKEEARRALMREIRETGCQNILMSTEALYYLRKPMRLRSFFKGFRITPVVSLRRQDEWLESAYREQFKNGATDLDCMTYLEQTREAMDYVTVLERWREAFPDARIIVLPFEKSENSQPIERRFLQAIGARISGRMLDSPIKNESFNRDALAFYHAFRESPRLGIKHALFKQILSRYSGLHKDSPETRYFYDPATRAALVAEHDAGNRRIAAEYLGRPGTALFTAPPPSADDPYRPYPGLSPEKAVEIAEFLANEVYASLSKEK